MKKGLFIVILLNGVLWAQESVPDSLQIEDRWTSFDKVQHLSFSCLWMLSVQYVLVNKGEFDEAEAYPVALSTGVLLGLGKEWYDKHRPNGYFSRRDLFADGVGLALASLIILF